MQGNLSGARFNFIEMRKLNPNAKISSSEVLDEGIIVFLKM